MSLFGRRDLQGMDSYLSNAIQWGRDSVGRRYFGMRLPAWQWIYLPLTDQLGWQRLWFVWVEGRGIFGLQFWE
jgi:hypothetical protein